MALAISLALFRDQKYNGNSMRKLALGPDEYLYRAPIPGGSSGKLLSRYLKIKAAIWYH
jgi:hypothetical protein